MEEEREVVLVGDGVAREVYLRVYVIGHAPDAAIFPTVATEAFTSLQVILNVSL